MSEIRIWLPPCCDQAKFSNFISAPQGHEMKFKFHELFRVVVIPEGSEYYLSLLK